MRKIVLGMVAATIAIPAAASAQPGYYDNYRSSQYSHPYDFNRDGVVTEREYRRGQIEAERQARYGSSYGNYNSYGSYGSAYPQQSYGGGYYPQQSYSGGYYPQQSYGGGYYPQQSYSGAYSGYYNQQGYYSGPTWRGDDGRYHCRRSDGSTGTVIGAGVGALIGSQIAGYGDRTTGAVIGGAVGALIGSRADSKNRYRCN
jgi:hypothetical protein